jgi:hypothetical protein
MGLVRHRSAPTTHAVRAAIQRSQASLVQLSMELGINPKTVAKQRKRATIEDMKTGPREPRSTVPTEAEEAAIVAIRRHTLLPLDDCLYALQPWIPHLTRSALPAAERYLSPARNRAGRTETPRVQALPHWLISY